MERVRWEKGDKEDNKEEKQEKGGKGMGRDMIRKRRKTTRRGRMWREKYYVEGAENNEGEDKQDEQQKQQIICYHTHFINTFWTNPKPFE